MKRIEIMEGFVVRPGETLVLKVPEGYEPEEVQEIHDEMVTRLPDGAELIIVAGEVEFAKVEGKQVSGSPAQ